MKKTLLIVLTIIIFAGVAFWLLSSRPPKKIATNFEECVANGNPVMESYPRQCRQGSETFSENIGNELEKANLIRITSPRPNQTVKSPLTIKGEARGFWFFEASFPISITDWDGKIIGEGYATAKGEWMTTEFVPFEAVLKFTPEKQTYSNRGTLILRKDNASGLPEHDDALEIPVIISGESVSSVGTGGGTSGSSSVVTSADNAPPGSIHNLPVPKAVSAVRTLVAKELGISEGIVIVMTAYEKNWSDGCLGLAKSGEFCTQATVSGYEVTVEAQGKERVYRTNADGSVIRRAK